MLSGRICSQCNRDMRAVGGMHLDHPQTAVLCKNITAPCQQGRDVLAQLIHTGFLLFLCALIVPSRRTEHKRTAVGFGSTIWRKYNRLLQPAVETDGKILQKVYLLDNYTNICAAWDAHRAVAAQISPVCHRRGKNFGKLW